MKKLFLTAIILSMVFVAVQAQDEKPFKDGKRSHKGHHGMMMKDLNLSEDQKAKMKTLNEDFSKQMAELKKNEDITVKEMKDSKEAIVKNHRSQVQNLLTSDQKAQIEKIKQERKTKRQEGSKARFEKMKTNLGLTDAQQAQLEKNRKASMEKMKAIRENEALSNEQKKAQMMELRKEQKEQMKSILTEEQLKKLKEGNHRHGKGKSQTTK